MGRAPSNLGVPIPRNGYGLVPAIIIIIGTGSILIPGVLVQGIVCNLIPGITVTGSISRPGVSFPGIAGGLIPVIICNKSISSLMF